LFRPGRRHWSGRAIRVEVHALLAEIAQQMAGFEELGIAPDDRVHLCGLPPGGLVVLDRRQWALAAEITGPQTARALARRSGHSLSATIRTLASLVTAGVVERGAPVRPLVPSAVTAPPAPEPAAREPASREPPTRKPPVRESGVGAPAVEERPAAQPLPHRVRGATPLPPGPGLPRPEPDPRPRMPRREPLRNEPLRGEPLRSESLRSEPFRSEPQRREREEAADSGRALALRLLEGLRRL
jgi:hypothetical protein